MKLWMRFKIFQKYKSEDSEYCSYYYYSPHTHSYTSLSGGMILYPTIYNIIAIKVPATTAKMSTFSLPNKLPIATVVARYFERSKNTFPPSFLRSLFIYTNYITGRSK